MILGSLESAEFGITHGQVEARLEPGDVLLIYSDGLTEATGPDDELFGEQRVLDLVREHAPSGGAGLRERILAAVEAFTQGREQSDDITIVVAARPG